MQLKVDVPKPGTPDSGEIIDKGTDLGSWLVDRPGTFWTLIVIAVIALVITSLLKRPFVRGLVLGAIILAVLAIAYF